MVGSCEVCKSVQPDVMTNVKSPFCLRLKGPADVYADAEMTHDTSVQGKCHIPPGKTILLTGWARRMKGTELRDDSER